MRQGIVKNELFQASQLTILLSHTIFAGILAVETFVMGWEKWPLLPILIGVLISWSLHVEQKFTDQQRIWIYTVMIMFSFFFYGSHTTSVYDTVAVMSLSMLLYTMTGMKALITFLQILYYLTFAYGIGLMWMEGVTFDALIISRSILHVVVVTVVAWVARMIITKWIQVLGASSREIDMLTDATDRLNDFLANVSHEIRTPVNAIIGLSGIGIEEETDPEKKANLISVRNAGLRVAEQIGDILDYSEIDRKRLVANFEDYMLASLFNDLVNELRPYKRDEIELVIDVDPSIPSVLHTDVSKLRKILRHLIMNGLKYTKEGGVYVRICAEKQDYGINLFIEVTDTGIGMTEEECERISERFYQADSGRSRKSGGLGLGMAVVSGFVASLGGFMTLKSKVGEGTTVRVSIPQKVVDPAGCMSVADGDKLVLGAYLNFEKFPHPIVREYYNTMVRNIVAGLGVKMHRVDNVSNLVKLMRSVQLTHLFVGEEEYLAAREHLEKLTSQIMVVVVADHGFQLPAGSKARIMEKPFYCFPVAAILNMMPGTETDIGNMYCHGVRALVVDDEPMNLTVAQNIFRRYGMEVTTAASGQESIDLCRERPFDIVFMDHMMPGMDGVEAMRRIRAEGGREHGTVPIVALTANAVSSAKEMFLSVGFDGFVSKPIELVELERVLKRVLPKSAITFEKKKELPQDMPAEESKEAAGQEKDTFDAKLAACGIDAKAGIGYSAGDEEFYRVLLEQYVTESAEKLEKLERFRKEKNAKEYQILVHALKSTSRTIGNAGLSDHAKELEDAAKAEDFSFIEAHHDAVMAEYRTTVDGIIAACGITAAKEPDADEVLEFAAETEPVRDLTLSGRDKTPEAVLDFTPVKDAEEEILEFAPAKETPIKEKTDES